MFLSFLFFRYNILLFSDIVLAHYYVFNSMRNKLRIVNLIGLGVNIKSMKLRYMMVGV